MGGKLYLLVEKNQELRLICLDPAKDPNKGENPISWSQALAAAKEKILNDVGRRMRVAPLAYGDGILVCPTNAGAILGVDLLSHSLVWARPYREESPAPDANSNMMNRRGMMWNGQMPNQDLNSHWKASAPILQDGKVVFTPPDANVI